MNNAEKAALEWLDEAGNGHETYQTNLRYRAIIKAMLAEPRLPAEPSKLALTVMALEIGSAGSTVTWVATAREIYRALYIHLITSSGAADARQPFAELVYGEPSEQRHPKDGEDERRQR